MCLTNFQDSLTPLPVETVEAVIKSELGRPVSELFASFETKPLGVASIGEVHGATLPDGTEVVIKVQKPGVKEQVTEDLEICVRWVNRRRTAAKGCSNTTWPDWWKRSRTR